jgi:hypothetical protein
MSIDLPTVYRDQMVRAVLGTRPAILATEADTAALNRIAQHLAEVEAATELMRAKGYGARGLGLLDMAKALPLAPPACKP